MRKGETNCFSINFFSVKSHGVWSSEIDATRFLPGFTRSRKKIATDDDKKPKKRWFDGLIEMMPGFYHFLSYNQEKRFL